MCVSQRFADDFYNRKRSFFMRIIQNLELRIDFCRVVCYSENERNVSLSEVKNMKATMKDIAQKTGLGLATISKYMNGGHVLEKNRIAIEAAIEELDYTVNEFARGLKTNRSKTVGVVIPQLNNIFMTSIITNVEEVLRRHGYGILVTDTGKDEEREEEAIRFLLRKKVDGLFIIATSKEVKILDVVLKNQIPVVVVDRKIERLEGITDTVLVENFQVAKKTVQYLIDRGHTKIGLLIGSRETYTSRRRMDGYREAFKENHIPIQEEWIATADFTVQGGYESTKRLLKEKEPITALFATNYEMTLGALLALNERGISIPEQVSLIGFDNPDLAKAMRPKLTLVSQPIEEIGKSAAKLLLERMELRETGKGKTIVLNASLEEGASVSIRGKAKDEK